MQKLLLLLKNAPTYTYIIFPSRFEVADRQLFPSPTMPKSKPSNKSELKGNQWYDIPVGAKIRLVVDWREAGQLYQPSRQLLRNEVIFDCHVFPKLSLPQIGLSSGPVDIGEQDQLLLLFAPTPEIKKDSTGSDRITEGKGEKGGKERRGGKSEEGGEKDRGKKDKGENDRETENDIGER